MTYHSLAIYYDNQLAENEQKRVPRKTVSQSSKLYRARKWQAKVLALAPFLEEAARHLPISFSPTLLSLTKAAGLLWPALL